MKYKVKSGDTLSKIAKEVYGDANRWREIVEANKDKIDNPNVIRPGWELEIPGAGAAESKPEPLKPEPAKEETDEDARNRGVGRGPHAKL